MVTPCRRSFSFVAAFLAIVSAACNEHPPVHYIETYRPAVHYIVPDGFEGWVVIRYGVAAAPALPLRDGAQIIDIPRCGVVRTSTEFAEGRAADRFLIRERDGALRPLRLALDDEVNAEVWDLTDFSYNEANGEMTPPITRFYVGSRVSYETVGKRINPADLDCGSK